MQSRTRAKTAHDTPLHKPSDAQRRRLPDSPGRGHSGVRKLNFCHFDQFAFASFGGPVQRACQLKLDERCRVVFLGFSPIFLFFSWWFCGFEGIPDCFGLGKLGFRPRLKERKVNMRERGVLHLCPTQIRILKWIAGDLWKIFSITFLGSCPRS